MKHPITYIFKPDQSDYIDLKHNLKKIIILLSAFTHGPTDVLYLFGYSRDSRL